MAHHSVRHAVLLAQLPIVGGAVCAAQGTGQGSVACKAGSSLQREEMWSGEVRAPSSCSC